MADVGILLSDSILRLLASARILAKYVYISHAAERRKLHPPTSPTSHHPRIRENRIEAAKALNIGKLYPPFQGTGDRPADAQRLYGLEAADASGSGDKRLVDEHRHGGRVTATILEAGYSLQASLRECGRGAIYRSSWR